MAADRHTSQRIFPRNSLKAARANARASRKREADDGIAVRRCVRTMWDVDDYKTQSMMDDVGVSLLEEEIEIDQDDPSMISPHKEYRELIPPGAPKVTVMGVPGAGLQTVYRTIDDDPPSQSFFLDALSSPGDLHSFLIRRPVSVIVHAEDYWHKLSDEMLLCIFRWLPKSTLSKCGRVCKRWNHLVFDESLWRRLDLATKNLKTGTLGRVLDRGVAVLRLARAAIQLPLYQGKVMQPKLCKLQYLDLSMAMVSEEGLEELLSYCHYLRKLSLENCDINDRICRLESLNVAWCNMSRGAVVYLVICLPPSLLKLNLSGCRETLLDEDVKQLCQSCPNVKELDLSDATLLTVQSVEYISTMLRGLEYMALSRCYHITPSALPMLGNILTLLAVDVFGVLKESGLRQLRELLSNIEVNKFPFSSIARPTTGIRRTSIWGLRVRDSVM